MDNEGKESENMYDAWYTILGNAKYDSIKIPEDIGSVLRACDLKANDSLVLIYLLGQAQRGKRIITAHVDSICMSTNLSRSYVYNSIKKLIKLGLVKGKYNRYDVLPMIENLAQKYKNFSPDDDFDAFATTNQSDEIDNMQ
jgi:DNA-binding MarR family transcriptional regulator